MNVMSKNLVVLACLCIVNRIAAQSNAQNNYIFSAITGTASKVSAVALTQNISSVKWVDGDSAYFKIKASTNRQLQISFQPSVGFVGVARAKAQARNTAGKIILTVDLTGLSTKGLEGENESPLSQIIDALGYSINPGWNTLAGNSLPHLQGDEIPAAIFRKAGNGKVQMIPVARYSPDFELPFGYYTKTINKHQVGTLSKATKFTEHQSLFPSISSGSTSFDPGNTHFGFYTTSPTHTAYSEDAWNMLQYPDNAVHATRIYPLKDKMGKTISNTYLLCFEEAKNGDYNDYVFIVKNITPVTTDPFIKLFNGKDLAGWTTFLNNIGTNKDPNNNFSVENGVLHVIGKDLGYAITQKGYRNYHFKVDFKWGERKWPPRQNDKRDAGICYNIPMNEPDSIWPRSVECQVQEGDVGDFWLLGFSTIKVNGIQNKPSAHTRMAKQRDAEKPYGEWNTVEVISVKGKCVHIVNGVVVNVGEEASIKEGRILLQSEYAEVYYRNAEIRILQ
jgi:hypothetical protein